MDSQTLTDLTSRNFLIHFILKIKEWTPAIDLQEEFYCYGNMNTYFLTFELKGSSNIWTGKLYAF